MAISTINHMLNSVQALPLRALFPEFTEAQFRVAALYTLGTSNQEAAKICGITEDAVKKHLRNCREALELEDLASVRVLFNCRMLAGLYATIAETPPASRPTGIC
jgi:DNA-binding NarL/FixJ family response regulator